MSLAARLLLAFGVVALLATALVGISVREASREIIEGDFESRIEAAARGVSQELEVRSAASSRLLKRFCDHDTAVDKALLVLERAKGDPKALEPDDWIRFRHMVPEQAEALELSDLALVAGDGTILGAKDVKRVGGKEPRLAALLAAPPSGPTLRPLSAGGEQSIEFHCQSTKNGVTVGLVGASPIAPLFKRVGEAYRLKLDALDTGAPVPKGDDDYVVQPIDAQKAVSGLRVVATVPRREVKLALEKLDAKIVVAGATALAIAFAIAMVLARSLSRPIVALAHETRQVLKGEPTVVTTRGGREIGMLAESFNHTITELLAMKRRLANTERIHARREVARQIAHEIKNPLAPIRAAVETLRRLRARDDPAFDEYFEEATSTVLGEVHRIANIVTEFTKFARLPAPSPEPIDLAQVAGKVVKLHDGAPGVTDTAGKTVPRVELTAEPMPKVLADRDQMIQVLTNLIQNGLDAASAVRPDPRVTVSIGPIDAEKVRVVVRDNGPGVPETLVPRLFEPYVTTKEKGTGLGLAIVQRIVFEHGGEITYRTATKGGAVFEIVLPMAGPPLLEREPSADVTNRNDVAGKGR